MQKYLVKFKYGFIKTRIISSKAIQIFEIMSKKEKQSIEQINYNWIFNVIKFLAVLFLNLFSNYQTSEEQYIYSILVFIPSWIPLLRTFSVC